MDNDQTKPNPESSEKPKKPEHSVLEKGTKLGRDRPGEGLDTGVDTGAMQPGKGATSLS